MTSANDRKYQSLVGLLDDIVLENALTLNQKAYRPLSDEERDQARSRAFIHLYLKASHSISKPLDREHLITDGTHDGGLDGYVIDQNAKEIVLIQSKFRSTPSNFIAKQLDNSEIATLQIDEIVRGEQYSSQGYKFSGHISKFQSKLSNIKDIAEYKFRILILANINQESKKIIERIYTEYDLTIFDFERTYEHLLYPSLTSESKQAKKIVFEVDTSKKNKGPRVEAQIMTRHGPSQMFVVLVPAIEIAKLIIEYKNSVLSFNPRSYLEFSKQGTNSAIRDSIINNQYDEFAIFNNGITMIADRCDYSDKTGKLNRASFSVHYPQIINGGQTAFTLAKVLEELDNSQAQEIFSGKEVLLKVIALGRIAEGSRESLAIDISRAANTQTAVTYADRKSNTAMHRSIAQRFFDATGLLYEYKTGLFEQTRKSISDEIILDRNLFHRLLYCAQGEFNTGAKSKLMQKGRGIIENHPTDDDLLRVGRLFQLYQAMENNKRRRKKSEVDKFRDLSVGWGVVGACEAQGIALQESQIADLAVKRWESFLTFCTESYEDLDPDLLRSKDRKRKTGFLLSQLNNVRWKEPEDMLKDLIAFGNFLLSEHNLAAGAPIVEQGPRAAPTNGK